MARIPRSVLADVPVHVVQRGNNRQAAFFSSGDYRVYLESLRFVAEHTACAIHAYVLMTNHVHLLITPATPLSLSRLMQGVGRRYVRYVNAAYARTGTLWEGRFRSAVVDHERYLLSCMRYIELNPVRANIVDMPGGYRWSSHARNAFGASDPVITPHPVYEALADDLLARRAAYRDLFLERLSIEADQASIRSGTLAGTPIGDDQFRKGIAVTLNRRVEKLAHGGDRRGKRFKSLSSTLTP